MRAVEDFGLVTSARIRQLSAPFFSPSMENPRNGRFRAKPPERQKTPQCPALILQAGFRFFLMLPRPGRGAPHRSAGTNQVERPHQADRGGSGCLLTA